MQKVVSVDSIPKPALEHRRCLLLTVVGAAPSSSPSVAKVISEGYLNYVKVWLDDILKGAIGGVDLLLHLLSSIVELPVTKSTVKDSGMGKAVGSIEKHSICKGTPNEAALKERINLIKDAWNAAVKAQKPETSKPVIASLKRPTSTTNSSPPASKRIKTTEESKKTSFSSLLMKVSGSPKGSAAVKQNANPLLETANDDEPKPDQAVALSTLSNLSSVAETGKRAEVANAGGAGSSQLKSSLRSVFASEKSSKRVKWADHFGSELMVTQILEELGSPDVEQAPSSSVSWSDKKKRDRLKEKELLSRVKRAKLIDDEEEDGELQPQINVSVVWRTPALLPERPDVTKAQLNSKEVASMEERMRSLPRVQYSSESEVPLSPAPLSDVEQAVDMTSQSAAVVSSIPFFVPVHPPPLDTAPSSLMMSDIQAPLTLPFPLHNGATPEYVQSLGLPMFLVGQDAQALQTLASSPSLLSTMVDASGMYDQTRLLTLVQTLSSSASQLPTLAPFSNALYGNQSSEPLYGQTASFSSSSTRNGYRGSNSEGNLHISGYGQGTTQADIVALFAPYVQVDEVVLKGTFAFVNTSDPVNAQRAREALNGTLLGGMPVRINAAQRKAREPSAFGGTPAVAPLSSSYVGAVPSLPAAPSVTPALAPPTFQLPPLAAEPINVDAVRDDRGNPATKNLFVAGYGPGTTEQQLRDIFNQHVAVIGVVSKGSFTFVNTADRESAVHAREMLGGTMLNGGVLRINFAKETGRLGTSFDLTYGPNTGPNAQRSAVPSNATSYYGRSF